MQPARSAPFLVLVAKANALHKESRVVQRDGKTHVQGYWVGQEQPSLFPDLTGAPAADPPAPPTNLTMSTPADNDGGGGSSMRAKSTPVDPKPAAPKKPKASAGAKKKRGVREDAHSILNLNPTDYELVTAIDNQPPIVDPMSGGVLNAEDVAHARKWRAEYEKNGAHIHGIGRCDHCGANTRYNVIFEHKPTGKLVSIGETCATERLGLDSRASYEVEVLAKRAKANRERAKAGQRVREFYEEHPGLEGAFALADEMLEKYNPYWSPPSQYRDAEEGETPVSWLPGKVEIDFRTYGEIHGQWQREVAIPYEHRLKAGLEPRIAREVSILRDIHFKLVKYHALSEKQIALVHKLAQDILTEVERAKTAAANPPDKPPFEPLEHGTYPMSGRIVSTKYVQNQWGGGLKMLVELDGGSRVFGSIPASIESLMDEAGVEYQHRRDALKGQRVTLTATVQPKEPDFGFFSRPRNATLPEWDSRIAVRLGAEDALRELRVAEANITHWKKQDEAADLLGAIQRTRAAYTDLEEGRDPTTAPTPEEAQELLAKYPNTTKPALLHNIAYFLTEYAAKLAQAKGT